MTKYRKSATKLEKQESAPVAEQKTGSGYNPETWTQQFFREKREAEERAAKVVQKDGLAEGTKGQEKGKGIPIEKGIPGHGDHAGAHDENVQDDMKTVEERRTSDG